MNKKGNIEAFTIMETIVGMAVTAIVISVIFVIFSITSARLQEFKVQNEYTSDINRFIYSIDKEIFESNAMYLEENRLTFKASNRICGTYIFNNVNPLFLKGEFKDTFKIQISNPVIDTIWSKDKTGFQRLRINIDIYKDSDTLNFYKKIYPNDLLKKILKNES